MFKDSYSGVYEYKNIERCPKIVKNEKKDIIKMAEIWILYPCSPPIGEQGMTSIRK